MNAIVSETECDSLSAQIDPAQWTAIIPAAGHGSRLGFGQPKILFPLLGRPILDWVLDALRPSCRRFVFILSPSGQEPVSPVIRERLGAAGEVVIQENPTGMGDAVLCAQSVVRTPYSLVVWGDQITLSQRTVQRCASLHQAQPGAALTLPTILKRQPYIHFVRGPNERIIEVLQARERPILHDVGESDCGLFLFTTTILFHTLNRARREGIGLGATTREFNLLQALPEFELCPGAIRTLRISDYNETLGVNTPEDAKNAEAVLRQRALISNSARS